MKLKRNEKWTIAYRRKSPEKTLLDDMESVFAPLPNTWRYWRADPFLFEKNGKTYLFAELFDRIKGRGVLGCCELSDTGAKNWKIIIDEPFHLSYPFVFQYNNEIYLIPESFRAGKISLYKAVHFPDRWEKIRDLSNMVAVDSTLVDTPLGSYLIAVRIMNREEELVLMKMHGQMVLSEPRVISKKCDPNVRPAGKVFFCKNQLIRPAQDCTESYGYGLNFYQISSLDEEHYEEVLETKILPKDIAIKGIPVPEGIHTYNFTDQYEVIDFKQYEYGIVCKVAKVIRYLRSLLFRK